MSYSIRLRLTLWYTALLATILVLFSATVITIHGHWSRAQFDAGLVELASTLSKALAEELGESGDIERAAAEMRAALDVPDHAVAVLDSAGHIVAADWNGLSIDIPDEQLAGSKTRVFTIVRYGRSWRVLIDPHRTSSGTYTVLIAGTLDQLLQQQAGLEHLLMAATPLMVLVSAVVCWLTATSALRPIRVLAAQAEQITETSPTWRLASPPRNDEVGQLANAFNRLLDRLASASEAQRQFMADASHELRTPVSVIQTTTEVMLDRPTRDSSEYRDALTIIGEQSERLQRRVDDMLMLARADAGGWTLRIRPVDLDETVDECVHAFSSLATNSKIALRTFLERDVRIMGDEMLLQQLISNLLNNAVQHTLPGGDVTLTLSRDVERSEAVLTVFDTGPGIPIADRERVFGRFVRLDPSRSNPGAGLGLPIARWIAEQHGGTVTIEEGPDGAGCAVVFRCPFGATRKMNAT
jgi:heavy metal sensor kinase